MLSRAHTFDKIAIAIDHIYDLQHNEGSALSKVKEYSGDWLAWALNDKLRAKNIRQLIPKCSSDMKKLALQAARAGGIPPLEAYDDMFDHWVLDEGVILLKSLIPAFRT